MIQRVTRVTGMNSTVALRLLVIALLVGALLPMAPAGAALSGSSVVATSRCDAASPDRHVAGQCFELRKGSLSSLLWVGTISRGNSPVGFCTDFLYETNFDASDPVTTLSGVRNQRGQSIGASELKALSYLLWKHPASTASNAEATAISYLIRAVFSDGYSDRLGEWYITPGLKIGQSVPTPPFAMPTATVSLMRSMWSEAAQRFGPWSMGTPSLDRTTYQPGQSGTLTLTARTGSGAALGSTDVALTWNNATGPKTVRTDAAGRATAAFTAGSALGDLGVTARIGDAPGAYGSILRPPDWTYTTNFGSGSNRTQRLLFGTPDQVATAASASVVVRYSPAITTVASAAEVTVGATLTDQVTITGIPPGYSGSARATLFGPFGADPTGKPASCDSTAPVAGTVSITNVSNPGTAQITRTYTTPGVTVPSRGWYTWQIRLPASLNSDAAISACGAARETTLTRGQPDVTTVVSSQLVQPGDSIRDTIRATGLDGSGLVVDWTLHGPFATPPTASSCTAGNAIASGTVTFSGDGSQQTPDSPPLSTPSAWWTYRIAVDPARNPTFAAFTSACGEPAETTSTSKVDTSTRTVVRDSGGNPVSEVSLGSTVHDQIRVDAGTATPVTIEWSLHGPFPARPGPSTCTIANQVASGTLSGTAPGDFDTPGFTVTTPGFYAYVAQVPASGTLSTSSSVCGEASETFWAKPRVTVRTTATAADAGGLTSDQIEVQGLEPVRGVEIRATLFGPFDTDPTGDPTACTPARRGPTVTVLADRGSGSYSAGPVEVTAAGYYTWVAEVPDTLDVDGGSGVCGEASETFLARAHPAITTKLRNQLVKPGGTVTDLVLIEGLPDTASAPVTVEWFAAAGPRDPSACAASPIGRSQFTATGSGLYSSPPLRVPLDFHGYLTARATLAPSAFVDGATHPCGLTSETALVPWKPRLATTASAQSMSIPGTVFDTVALAGVPAGVPGRITVALYGPVATQESAAEACVEEKLVGVRELYFDGPGKYASPIFDVTAPGYYTFRATLLADREGRWGEVTHPCGMAQETLLAGNPEEPPSPSPSPTPTPPGPTPPGPTPPGPTPPGPTPPGPTPPGPTTPPGAPPITGSAQMGNLLAGIALVLCGSALVVLARRSRFRQ